MVFTRWNRNHKESEAEGAVPARIAAMTAKQIGVNCGRHGGETFGSRAAGIDRGLSCDERLGTEGKNVTGKDPAAGSTSGPMGTAGSVEGEATASGRKKGTRSGGRVRGRGVGAPTPRPQPSRPIVRNERQELRQSENAPKREHFRAVTFIAKA